MLSRVVQLLYSTQLLFLKWAITIILIQQWQIRYQGYRCNKDRTIGPLFWKTSAGEASFAPQPVEHHTSLKQLSKIVFFLKISILPSTYTFCMHPLPLSSPSPLTHTHPSRNPIYFHTFLEKCLLLPPPPYPLEYPVTLGGEGVNIFWNCTLISESGWVGGWVEVQLLIEVTDKWHCVICFHCWYSIRYQRCTVYSIIYKEHKSYNWWGQDASSLLIFHLSASLLSILKIFSPLVCWETQSLEFSCIVKSLIFMQAAWGKWI